MKAARLFNKLALGAEVQVSLGGAAFLVDRTSLGRARATRILRVGIAARVDSTDCQQVLL